MGQNDKYYQMESSSLHMLAISDIRKRLNDPDFVSELNQFLKEKKAAGELKNHKWFTQKSVHRYASLSLRMSDRTLRLFAEFFNYEYLKRIGVINDQDKL